MTHYFEIEFKAHPAEARRARVCTRDQLASWGLEDLIETAELLVSELVGNAVVHTTTPATLRLAYSHTLRMEVTDTSPQEPHAQSADVYDESGRGLELVGLFSDRWDWHRDAVGKTVWCELAGPATATI